MTRSSRMVWSNAQEASFARLTGYFTGFEVASTNPPPTRVSRSCRPAIGGQKATVHRIEGREVENLEKGSPTEGTKQRSSRDAKARPSSGHDKLLFSQTVAANANSSPSSHVVNENGCLPPHRPSGSLGDNLLNLADGQDVSYKYVPSSSTFLEGPHLVSTLVAFSLSFSPISILQHPPEFFILHSIIARMPLSGHCLCKAVTYTVDVDAPLIVGYDHCDDCQRQSGSTYCRCSPWLPLSKTVPWLLTFPTALVAVVPKDKLTVNGPIKKWSGTGSSGHAVHRLFCSDCGSPIAHDPDAAPEIIALKAGTFDTEIKKNLKPDTEIWTVSKLPFCQEHLEKPFKNMPE
ncbi:glutathione-dependent formaldehyde-activating enzyme [Aspergillus luchuensis]|uniref:Glutathione-dependent formaldehyde-activating enzyme n=1 Tax=Aspergillus kawachii TaxID=1069201 RepID=A0A146F3T8_ASPKA|nr:glutathione-dependent formaldehyde-activating enzyme [Aspergillus luchuensis]